MAADLERYAAPELELAREGNLALDAGKSLLWKLAAGISTAYFDAANARLGVGDGTAAADAAQDGLQGTSTAYRGMVSGFPSVSADTITFKAEFGADEANFAWEEWVVDNGASGGVALNRKVEANGTKTAGAIRTLEVSLQLS